MSPGAMHGTCVAQAIGVAGNGRRGERATEQSIIGPDLVEWNHGECEGLTPGLLDGSSCVGGEESAEITEHTDKDPGEHYRELTAERGAPCYTRIDASAAPAQEARLAYAASFADQAHPDTIVAQARAIVDRAMGSFA